MLHVMLNEGLNDSVRCALMEEAQILELASEANPKATACRHSSILAYAQYLQVRVRIAQRHRIDLCIPAPNYPDFLWGSVEMFLDNGTLDALLEILGSLCGLKVPRPLGALSAPLTRLVLPGRF